MAVLSDSQLDKIIHVHIVRFEKTFQKKMSLKLLKELRKYLLEKQKEEALRFKFSENKLMYFFYFKKQFMGEFQENFFQVTHCFCVAEKKARQAFYREIKKSALKMKKAEGVKRMSIVLDRDDSISKSYYGQLGNLTFIELVGKTTKSLSLLKGVSSKTVKISKMQSRDVNKLINLDLASHLADKTSRMRTIFMKPDAKKQMRMFYKGLLKRKSCFVAREKKKLAGNIGYFVDEKNNHGLIACIFVANEFKGKGISKLLYKTVLNEFKKKKLNFYIGGTTTVGVLEVAKKIGRVESKSIYLVKI